MPLDGDVLGIFVVVTAIFCGTTLAGIARALGVTDVTVHGAAGAAEGAAGSSWIGMTCSDLQLASVWHS